ncbi:spore coat protein [Paenibacillus sp. 1P07SE]|uniref:spore coat protein n=1 Tax=Paenibacillus sp. 1P07SE TaxID=3132209 RepID=UPI0039A4EAB5
MNIILEHLTRMNVLTDQVIVMDYLTAAKSAVRNYAVAVTEAGTPEIKETLIRQLNESIDMHEQITNYLMVKGLYHPWDQQEQLQLDLQNIQTALSLPS